MSEEVIGLPRQALWFITLLRTGTITAGGLTILSWTQLLLPVAIDVAWSTRVGLGFSLGFFHIGYLYSMLPYWIEQNLDSPVSQDNKDSQLMVSVVEATCILTPYALMAFQTLLWLLGLGKGVNWPEMNLGAYWFLIMTIFHCSTFILSRRNWSPDFVLAFSVLTPFVFASEMYFSRRLPLGPYDFPQIGHAASYWWKNVYRCLPLDLVFLLLHRVAELEGKRWVRDAEPGSPRVVRALGLSIFTTLLVTGSYLPPNTLDHNFSVYSLLKYVVSESKFNGYIQPRLALLALGTANFARRLIVEEMEGERLRAVDKRMQKLAEQDARQ